LRGLPQAEPAGGEEFIERLHTAMQDDFNTPEALAVLFDMVREVNRLRDTDLTAAAGLGAELQRLGGMLGILQDDPEHYLRGGDLAAKDGLSDADINSLIQARIDARTAKNWAEADRIRDHLQNAGIILEDGPGGTVWRRG
jgi:cysteinyl-tRNA synthetase